MPHQCTNCKRTFADGSTEMLSGCPDCGGTKFQFRPDGFDDEADDPTESPPASESADEPDTPPEPPDRPGDRVSRTVGSAAATVRDIVGGSAGPDATDAAPPGSGSDSATANGGPDSATANGDDDIIVAESDPGPEDTAQADARSGVASPDEVPGSDGFAPATDDESGESDEPAGESDNPAGESGTAEPADSDSAGPEATDAAEPDGTEPDADGPTDAAGEDGRTVASEPDAERSDRPDLAELRKELNEQFESIRVVEPGQYELNLMELYDREEYIIALQEDGRYSIQVPDSWREADA